MGLHLARLEVVAKVQEAQGQAGPEQAEGAPEADQAGGRLRSYGQEEARLSGARRASHLIIQSLGAHDPRMYCPTSLAWFLRPRAEGTMTQKSRDRNILR